MRERSKQWIGALAALVVGPLVWATNMQLSQILPYPQCRNGGAWLLLAAVAALFAASVASVVSWRARGTARSSERRAFLAGVSALLGAAFAFALVLQVMATVMLTGCER